jgi:hypothetical protein
MTGERVAQPHPLYVPSDPHYCRHITVVNNVLDRAYDVTDI